MIPVHLNIGPGNIHDQGSRDVSNPLHAEDTQHQTSEHIWWLNAIIIQMELPWFASAILHS